MLLASAGAAAARTQKKPSYKMTDARSCNKKSCMILQNSCRILQGFKLFPARISLVIKGDLFWHIIMQDGYISSVLVLLQDTDS